MDGLRRLYPDLPLVVTTVTATGARVVAERLDGAASHRYFPLDFPAAVRRAVTAIDPAFFVCMETELWPNVLRELAARGVPTMIANGRLSDRSFRRYRLVRGRFPADAPQREFDVITMLAVLEHVPDDALDEWIDACRSRLRPGGRVVVSIPSPVRVSLISLHPAPYPDVANTWSL